MGLLHRWPFVNAWAISLGVFGLWHILYAWLYNAIMSEGGTANLGDDLSMAIIVGAFGIVGTLLGLAQKFVVRVEGTRILPNLLWFVGWGLFITAEVMWLVSDAYMAGKIEMKAVVIGFAVAGFFAIMQTALSLVAGLIKEKDDE